MPLDQHGQPLNRFWNARMRQDRQTDELIGLCRGVLADGALVQEEVEFIKGWLEQNGDVLHSFPGNVLYERIRESLQDGIVTADEEESLIDTMLALTGGSLQEDDAASNSASLVFDQDIILIEFENRSFCLTGRFASGTRRECERSVVERGGLVQPRVTRITNYVVVGAVGSRDWAHSPFGRKIEQALEYRESGMPIRIVSEEIWLSSLGE